VKADGRWAFSIFVPLFVLSSVPRLPYSRLIPVFVPSHLECGSPKTLLGMEKNVFGYLQEELIKVVSIGQEVHALMSIEGIKRE